MKYYALQTPRKMLFSCVSKSEKELEKNINSAESEVTKEVFLSGFRRVTVEITAL